MRNNKINFLLGLGVLCVSCAVQPAATIPVPETTQQIYEKYIQGGMWIPNELNEKDLKDNGLQISIKDIYDTQNPSLKDAIAQFNKGCSSGLISPYGLLLTNHHCGYGEIQSHSTLEHDYLSKGFWAHSFTEELVNPNTSATFIVDIQDVTALVNKDVVEGSAEEEISKIKQRNIELIKANTKREAYQEVEVKAYYSGNKYYKIISETYKDVRLVGAPPSSIGKFGSDTDNWMWPRYAGDFSLFRIYADANNHPAEFSPNNIPYKPKKYLKVSIGGYKEEDFTMVYGFPGKTQEYLPSEAIYNIAQITNPTSIKVREITLNSWNNYMRKNPEIKIKYAAKYASLANYEKKWKGENTGINSANVYQKKKNIEVKYKNALKLNPSLEAKYGAILPQLNQLYIDQSKYLKAQALYQEIFLRNAEAFVFANQFIELQKAFGTNDYANVKAQTIKSLKAKYANYDPLVDVEVCKNLLNLYMHSLNNTTESSYASIELLINFFYDWKTTLVNGNYSINGQTVLNNIEAVFADDTKLMEVIKNDPLIKKIAAIKQDYIKNTQIPYSEIQQKIDDVQETYVKSLLEVFSDKVFYPDANSTLRLAYGKIKPFTGSTGRPHPNQTYLSGVIQKNIPNDYEFHVDPALIDLFNKKDFGNYAENGDVPVDFIAANHTTGGNSGSPALDRNGNLIGLNFDRAWEGTMSDLYYDPSFCRNIMVDMRYIMFIIDKFANAQNLVQEINAVK